MFLSRSTKVLQSNGWEEGGPKQVRWEHLICICVWICICVCICVCEWEEGVPSKRGETIVSIAFSNLCISKFDLNHWVHFNWFVFESWSEPVSGPVWKNLKICLFGQNLLMLRYGWIKVGNQKDRHLHLLLQIILLQKVLLQKTRTFSQERKLSHHLPSTTRTPLPPNIKVLSPPKTKTKTSLRDSSEKDNSCKSSWSI